MALLYAVPTSSTTLKHQHPKTARAREQPPSAGPPTDDISPFPRVTRSMAAAREGPPSIPKQQQAPPKKSIRSKSPGLTIETTPHQPCAIVGMAWNRFSPIRNSNHDNEEQEVRESWRYTSQLIDRGGCFLPHATDNDNQHGACNDGGLNLFSSLTHLNVLCVATSTEIHWYLQGQYRILSVPHGLMQAEAGVDLVCSPDLSTLLY